MIRPSFLMFVLTMCLVGLASSPTPSEDIVFVGVVERIAPDTRILSGDIAVYRLVKYKIEKVCGGKFAENEIVVDHLVLDGNELKGVQVGDRVRVAVKKSKSVLMRFDAKGIREPSERVKVFFVGGKVDRCSSTAGSQCCK